MKNQISYKLAVARMYMHGYETSIRVYSRTMCTSHFNTTPDQQDRLSKLVKEQADLVYKYEKKLKPVMFALAHVERHMSRPQRRELNLLRDRCCGPWLSEIKEKTKIDVNSLIINAVDDLDLSRVRLCANDDFDRLTDLAIDTLDDLDLPVDDFDPIEDYYKSQADYSEDNPQDYGN